MPDAGWDAELRRVLRSDCGLVDSTIDLELADLAEHGVPLDRAFHALAAKVPEFKEPIYAWDFVKRDLIEAAGKPRGFADAPRYLEPAEPTERPERYPTRAELDAVVEALPPRLRDAVLAARTGGSDG